MYIYIYTVIHICIYIYIHMYISREDPQNLPAKTHYHKFCLPARALSFAYPREPLAHALLTRENLEHKLCLPARTLIRRFFGEKSPSW